jgi:inorganic triphosphatase YgiF
LIYEIADAGNRAHATKGLEIKLALDAASLPALKEIPLLRALRPTARRATEVSVYFDTETHKLRKNGVMLRVRRVADRHIQTIKATVKSGPFERDEWEAEVPGNEPHLNLAKGTALEPLLKNSKPLKPLFETRVLRSVYPVANEACAFAFTVDRGTIDTGNR